MNNLELESAFICPTCGSLESKEQGNYIICRSCGNRYRKKIQHDPIFANLVYAVNERQEADFDKARKRYDEIIEKHVSESGMEEAYWGRFLCEQYVIFYYNEEGEAIPSFWRINDEPCRQSKSYQKAIEYARFSGNMENYEKSAELIEEYKEKYRKVKKERPEGSQVFICFKDSGTDDANLGYKIYNKFFGKYNIFFSKESLNTMRGNDYEPYIYHALTTAKAMIVICSSRENLDSKWVHNEWWRFWKFSKSSEKTIIPIFRENFSASQLPEYLSNCQAHKEDVDLLSNLSERLDAILKNETDVPLTSFEKEWNSVNNLFETNQTDDAIIRIRELLSESMDRPHDHISALLLHTKIFSNNYKHLNNEHAAASIARAQELAKMHGVAIEDVPEYRRYRAAVAKKRFKIGLIAFLITAFVGVGAFFAWYMMRDTSVKNISNSKYHATAEAENGGFEQGTEFNVSEIQADNQMKSVIRLLPVDQNTYHLYDMELWRYGEKIEIDENVTVTLPLPSGISAESAVIYYLNEDSSEKIPSTVSKGNISFSTNHFSVYMIAEEKNDCNHIAVTDPAVNPTCDQTGLTQGQHCSICKETLTEQEVIPAKGHTPGQAANCTEAQHCTVCYTELTAALGHKPGAAANCVDPQKCSVCHIELAPARGHRPSSTNCTDAKTCTVCHIELEAAKGHTPGKEATCTEAQYCTACRAELTPAKGHTPGAPATCTESQNCTVCYSELRAALGHVPDKEATCTTGQNCKICRVELLPALGHTKPENVGCTEKSNCVFCGISMEALGNHTPGPEATCTESQRCEVCNVELIPAAGHKRPEGISCTASANCTVCGEFLKATSGHTPGPEATCTEAQYCTICNTKLKSANGHKAGAPATCTAAQKCTVCMEELVPAKGHTPGIAANCTNGQYCIACRSQIQPPLGHNPGPAATCTVGQNCTVCHIELTPASGHFPGAEATCTNAQNCLICGEELAPIKDHQIENWVVDKESIDGPLGIKRGNCSVCKQIIEVKILFSEGLTYSKNSDGTYTVTGIGTYKGEKLIIPPMYEGANVVAIKDYAFQNCTSLVSVEIPSSVQTIGIFAFLGCSNLSKLTLNEGLETINYGAFYKCPITSLIIPNSVTSMPVPRGVSYDGDLQHGAFDGCNKLTSVVIGNGLTQIDVDTFRNCTALESIQIGKNVQSIGEYAFQNCSSLASIEIPGNVETIGIFAFLGCSNLSDLTLNEGLKTICDGAFYRTGITKLVIPDSVTSMPVSYRSPYMDGSNYHGAFEYCEKLTHLEIGSGLTEIRTQTFNGCSALKSVVIKSNIRIIEPSAFGNCSELKHVYYTGTEEDWKKISIYTEGNNVLFSATIHYNADPSKLFHSVLLLKISG